MFKQQVLVKLQVKSYGYFYEFLKILFFFKERNQKEGLGKAFLSKPGIIASRFQWSFLHFNFNIQLLITAYNFPEQAAMSVILTFVVLHRISLLTEFYKQINSQMSLNPTRSNRGIFLCVSSACPPSNTNLGKHFM